MPVSEEGRIIIVSNRLPVSTSVIGDGWIVLQRSSGGLVNGLEDVHESGRSLWLGCLAPQAGAAASGLKVSESDLADLRNQGLRVVDVPGDLYEAYYEGFSNGSVWPLFHYMTDRCHFSLEQWEAYERVNQMFAEAIMAEVRENDTVWIQDYQLMLVPNLLRRMRRDLTIGFFLHLPFPSADVFRIMPWRRELLEGLLGSDLIGFHTLEYMRHFSNSLARVLGLEPHMDSVQQGRRTVRMGAFPLGIDVKAFHADARSPEAELQMETLGASYQGRKLILGVDRLDYTKGIPMRLEAFGDFLERKPEWIGKVAFVQVSVPSRVKVDEYQDLKSQVDRLVGKINGRFGTPGYVPIHYLFRTLPREHLLALYRRADVALVTPLRDGLNLVCKEYVAAKGDEPGALVLSEFAGSAAEMGEAILVNPWSREGMVDAIENALTMSDERKSSMMSELWARLARYDNKAWSQGFLGTLAKTRELNRGSGYALVSEPDDDELADRLSKARNAFFFIDYDGTLVPLADKPELALPSAEVVELLRGMAAVPNFRVAVVSGRNEEFLATNLPSNVTLIAEHGASIRMAGSSEPTHLVDESGLTDLWNHVVGIMTDFERRIPGSRIEKKQFGVVWHYRMAEAIFAQNQARELAEILGALLQRTPLGVTQAKKAVEVRHVAVNKGDAVRHILEQEEYDRRRDLLLTMGDDRTDEDMFKVYPKDNVSISVSDAPMSAAYTMDQASLVELLDRLARSAKGWQYKFWDAPQSA